MKKTVLFVAAALVGVFALKAFAADQPAYKFGYVDFQRALNDVEEGKKAKAMLKSEFDEKQKNLDAVQNQLQTMRADLDKQRLILSADALKEKEEEYRKKFIELQQKLASYKDELGMKEAKLTGDILVVIHKIVADIGAKENYSLILEKSQDVVLYSPTDADLTDRVIKAYNGMPKGEKDSIVKSSGPSVPALPKEKKK
jgi:outer membrane protein